MRQKVWKNNKAEGAMCICYNIHKFIGVCNIFNNFCIRSVVFSLSSFSYTGNGFAVDALRMVFTIILFCFCFFYSALIPCSLNLNTMHRKQNMKNTVV